MGCTRNLTYAANQLVTCDHKMAIMWQEGVAFPVGN